MIFDGPEWQAIREYVHERATADFDRFHQEFLDATAEFLGDWKAGERPSNSRTIRIERLARHAGDLAKASRNANAWSWYTRTPYSKRTKYALEVISDAQN